MRSRASGTSLALGLLLVLAAGLFSGCNNALNPLCASARPAPLIGSLSPSIVNFSQVQQGFTLAVNGSHFVSSSQVLINSTPLGANIVSPQLLKVKLTTDVITAPGTVKVEVQTPSGNTSDLGCSSGGTSSALMLTVN